MRKTASWLLVVLLPIVVTGGAFALRRDVSSRNREWPTQMQYSPAVQPQTTSRILPKGMAQQMPVAGTIPRGIQPFHYASGQQEELRAGLELTNPLEPTAENLARGEKIFATYCAVCHGPTGAGDGPIIPKYPNPPNYKSEKSMNLPDGAMYHVISMGRLNMPSHAAQVRAEDRWRVILHIRKLQGKVAR